MTKILIIAFAIILVIGIGYQVKQRQAGSHAVSGSNTTEHVAGTTAMNPDAKTASGAAGTAPTGTDVAGTQVTNTQGATAGVATSATTGTGASGKSATAESAPVKAAVIPPPAPKDNCFAFEYRHKKEAKDQDIENFLDYTNAFPIAHANYNPKSLCVKVNQKAVNYQVAKFKSNPEIRLGSVVGPESVIRVSYCVGKISPCHDTCAQPKKRFMDDLMSDASDEDNFNDSWGKGDDENRKKALKDKAKELRGIASENDHLNDSSVQRDWEELQKQEWVCK